MLIQYIGLLILVIMNKNDVLLIILICLVTIVLFVIPTRNNNYAYVYYDGNKIMDISLEYDNKYIVQGYNGDIVIEVLNNKIRVVDENSKNHICSKQGFTNSIPIVCLPNKIVIDFGSDNNLDTVVR